MDLARLLPFSLQIALKKFTAHFWQLLLRSLYSPCSLISSSANVFKLERGLVEMVKRCGFTYAFDLFVGIGRPTRYIPQVLSRYLVLTRPRKLINSENHKFVAFSVLELQLEACIINDLAGIFIKLADL